MKNTKTIVAAALLIISVLGFSPVSAEAALQPSSTVSGAYSTLFFPNCGIAEETGGVVTWYQSGQFGLIARDATGKIIGTLPISTIPARQYLATGLVISTTSFVNPISVDYLVNGYVYFTLTANSPCASNTAAPVYTAPGYTAPGYSYSTPVSSSAPSVFVLRIINCNTPVYNMPSGDPISGAFITIGQTWFINTKVPLNRFNVLAPDWTEVYSAGAMDGYVPTACVGGRPANYFGP